MMIQSVKYSHILFDKKKYKLLTFALNYFRSVNFATLIDTSFFQHTSPVRITFLPLYYLQIIGIGKGTKTSQLLGTVYSRKLEAYTI